MSRGAGGSMKVDYARAHAPVSKPKPKRFCDGELTHTTKVNIHAIKTTVAASFSPGPRPPRPPCTSTNLVRTWSISRQQRRMQARRSEQAPRARASCCSHCVGLVVGVDGDRAPTGLNHWDTPRFAPQSGERLQRLVATGASGPHRRPSDYGGR